MSNQLVNTGWICSTQGTWLFGETWHYRGIDDGVQDALLLDEAV
jgi:hypothetical protein